MVEIDIFIGVHSDVVLDTMIDVEMDDMDDFESIFVDALDYDVIKKGVIGYLKDVE